MSGRWPLAGAALVLVAAALGPRLWRFEAVGEGVDESYSVRGTRALIEGRFSYTELNDFAVDAYQAKLTPVVEGLAVPFVVVLGDRPASHRLPSLLASLALVLLVVGLARARWGTSAALAAGAFAALDYRSVVYAQTHRYVAVESLLAYLAFAATVRTRGRRLALAALAVVGLLAIHSHPLAVLALGGLLVAVVREDVIGARGARRWRASIVLALLCAWGLALLVVLRTIGLSRFSGGGSLYDGLVRSASTTARTLVGLSPIAAPLAVIGALRAWRHGARRERVLATTLLASLATLALLCARWPLAPRYALALQPFVWLLGAREAGRFLDRAAHRPLLATALVCALALPGLAVLAWYATTGGGRDVEAPIHRALVERAAPGDAVLWDVPLLDPYGRRPRAPRPVPRSHALMEDSEGVRRLAGLGVRWVVRSSGSSHDAIWTRDALARLTPVATSSAATSPIGALTGDVETLTLYAFAP